MNNFTPPNEFITIQIEALQENDFDFVLDVASHVFDSSHICLSFLGAKKQWYKSENNQPIDLNLHLSCYLASIKTELSDDILYINHPQEEFFLANNISSIISKALRLGDGAVFGHIVLLCSEQLVLTEKEQKTFRTFAHKAIELVEQNRNRLDDLVFEKKQLNILLDSTNDYIWCVDRNLNLISANKTYIDTIKNCKGITPKRGDYYLVQGIHSDKLIETLNTQCQLAFQGEVIELDIKVEATQWFKEQWMEVTIQPIKEEDKLDKLVITARNITKRKRDKERLKKSKNQYEALFLSNPQPMWIYDIENLYFLEVNEAAIRHYGYSRAEFLNMTLIDIRPADNPYIYLDYSNPNDELEDKHYEWKHIKKNGELIHVQVNTHGIRYQGRKARHALIIDVTDKELYLQLLENEKARTTALINSTDDLVWSIDREHRLVAANDAYYQLIEKIHGRPIKPGDYVNKVEGVNEQTKKAWDELHKKVFAGNTFAIESYTPEVSSIWGKWTDIMFNPIMEGDQVIGAAMFGRNITNRKLMELELEASQRILLEMSEVGKIGGWQFDIPNQILTWSAITKQIHEVPEDYEPTVSAGLMDYKEGPDRDAITNAFNEAVINGTPYDIEAQIITKAGKLKWVRIKASVEMMDGVPVRVYGMFQDINDQKKHLREIENQNKQLREIAWMQSHVMRAPVARIMGIVNLLKDYDSIEISNEELMQNILDSAYELDGIIRKINNTIYTDTTIV